MKGPLLGLLTGLLASLLLAASFAAHGTEALTQAPRA